MSNPALVFTYGTLRPGLSNQPEALEFQSACSHLGQATFQGKLYAVGWYPVAIDSPQPTDIVKGDLFQLTEIREVLAMLDAYEGCAPNCPEPHEYIRTIRTVLHNGRETQAWVYLFNGTITGQTRIDSGDFADYVNP